MIKQRLLKQTEEITGVVAIENLTEKQYQLKEKYGDEYVMVIDTDIVPESMANKEFIYADERVLSFIGDVACFVPRYLAESNPTYRQPIPYIVVKVNGKYMAIKRLSGAGESRLHDQISLGLGGHINPEDGMNNVAETVFENALFRELNEELEFPRCASDVEFVGIINDLSNAVSREHIGLLFIANLYIGDDEKVQIKEVDKYEGQQYTFNQLNGIYENLESWSKIVYDNVIKSWGVNL